MSKLDEKISLYNEKIKDIEPGYNSALLEKITRGLGPSIYNKDAESIACSDPSELDRVRTNFLKKKLGLTEDDAVLDKAIKEVCEQMGSANRNKYRAIFYYLLTVKFSKESVYA
ncbi:MAG: DUF2853 family protein [Sulfurimonas sp.]|jgi:hypothetical protein